MRLSAFAQLGLIGCLGSACGGVAPTYVDEDGTGASGAGTSVGGSGAAPSGGAAGSGGQPLPCMTPADCPSPANATATCNGGQCGYSCDADFGDCDDSAQNGCEADLNIDDLHCGSCDAPCTSGCSNGVCNGIVDIDAGYRHACAVTLAGEVWCWGENASGEVGDGTTAPHPTPYNVDLPLKAKAVSTGGGFQEASHSCALMEDNTVYCWGSEALGNPGSGFQTDPIIVVGSTNTKQILSGGNHACLVRTDGDLRCWGHSQEGELGTGQSVDNISQPTSILTDVLHAEASQTHTCAVRLNGDLYCWGRNGFSESGQPFGSDVTSPMKVEGIANVDEVAVGGEHTCALSTNEVSCFGSDYSGALGINNFSWTETPTLVTLPDVRQVATGAEFTAALSTASHDLFIWGEGAYPNGENNEYLPSNTGYDEIARIALGFDFGCMILRTGEVQCWGDNQFGQCGTGGAAFLDNPGDVVIPLVAD